MKNFGKKSVLNFNCFIRCFFFSIICKNFFFIYYLRFSWFPNVFTFKKGFRSGAKLLYHCLFIFFWEHVWATTSYIKFSYAKVSGLECIPHISASVSIRSMACLVFSSYILSIMSRQRCSNNLHKYIKYQWLNSKTKWSESQKI